MRPLDGFHSIPHVVARCKELPLADWLDRFIEHLQSLQYDQRTISAYLVRLCHFANYLQERNLPLHSLADHAVVQGYLEAWGNKFQNQYGHAPKRATLLATSRAVRRLIDCVRQAGFLPPAAEHAPSLPAVVVGYLDFCKTHRGISASACRAHERYLQELSDFCREQGVKDMKGIPIVALDGFIARMGRRLKRETLHGLVGVVRSFLRYLFVVGEEPQDRSAWVEYPSVFREMKLPRHMSDAELDQALNHVDRSTASGKRDWAVLMLLSNYGLRIGEAARLGLPDLDFAARRLRVHRVKGGGVQWFPMTPAVSEALLDYIRNARPKSPHCEVFLTFKPPPRPFHEGFALATVCVRKHIPESPTLPARGAHVFRHTVARRLRQAGAPLGVMRKILGHESAETTNRYLHIVLEELREVADNYAELL